MHPDFIPIQSLGPGIGLVANLVFFSCASYWPLSIGAAACSEACPFST